MLVFSFFFIKIGNGEPSGKRKVYYIPKYGKISGLIYERTDSSYYKAEQKPFIKKRLTYIEQKYRQQIIRSSLKYKIPKELVIAIIYIENGKDVNPKAIGSSGEEGLMQIRPTTARVKPKSILLEPSSNIEIGSKILSQIMYESIEHDSIIRFDKVAIRYNAGYHAYNKCKNLHNLKYSLDSINPITRKYVLRLVGKNGILEILNTKDKKLTI